MSCHNFNFYLIKNIMSSEFKAQTLTLSFLSAGLSRHHTLRMHLFENFYKE
ncbi:hypothetical protein GMMP15_1330015 [Candidatus Magnetomoraceae bacterium gMMP-15]